MWNYPHCLGAIDGKHINMFAPPNSGSLYYDYMGNFSLVLLAVVDADLKLFLRRHVMTVLFIILALSEGSIVFCKLGSDNRVFSRAPCEHVICRREYVISHVVVFLLVSVLKPSGQTLYTRRAYAEPVSSQ